MLYKENERLKAEIIMLQEDAKDCEDCPELDRMNKYNGELSDSNWKLKADVEELEKANSELRKEIADLKKAVASEEDNNEI